MVLAESIDRHLRHIRPICEEGLLGLEAEPGRYAGRPIELSGGARVERGDRVGVVHLRNDRVRALVASGWQRSGYREARADLQALAASVAAQAPSERPVAFLGTTILAPLIAREGWEIRLVPPTWRTRLDRWWMSWLMAHFGRRGRERVVSGHHRLEVSEVWISTAELLRRYGPARAGSTPELKPARARTV